MRSLLKTFVPFLLLSTLGNSQGLIINEFANDGANEWVELLVLGDPAFPNNPVDLTGWILDDNGGNFEGSVAGVGIADGHLKFKNNFNAVPPGSLIVLYSEGNRSAVIPGDDPTDANNDSVYILPGNHSSLEVCTSLPVIGTFNYNCTPTSSPGWNYISMRSAGDAIQTRSPLAVMFHGFSFGDVTAPFPLFPSTASSWNIGSGSSGKAYAFQCGNWEDKSSFNEINEPASTPGSANGTTNTIFINKLRNGSFNYTSLDSNCAYYTTPTTPIPTPLPEVIIPNVFSPNGDSKNELFMITNLLSYPTKELTIYNRWGLVVYESKSYQNDWNGKDTEGKPVVDGTYYYVLNIGRSKEKRGSVALFR